MVQAARCAPPVPARIGLSQPGTLPLAYVLSELDAVGLQTDGLYLWRALRRLDEWLREREEGRSLELPPASYADAAPEIQPTLHSLHWLFREPDPDESTVEALALGFAHLAVWAEGRGAYRTAVAMLQGADALFPENPYFAYSIGRVARKMAWYDDAEAWLKWAHFVARGGKRWDVAALALSGLGNLYRQRGNLPRARRLHTLTWKLAKRRGLRTLEGDALYDLAVIDLSGGNGTSAAEYAKRALTAYGPGHGQVYRLANDFAWFWMDSYGKFENAATVFITLHDHIWEPALRVLLFANTARAVAGAGWLDVFEVMWIETWVMIRQQVNRQGHAAALTQLALGAGNLGQWERVRLAAAEALQVATERREAEAMIVSEEILALLGAEVLDDERIRKVFKDRSRRRDAASDESSADLAAEFTNAMKARRDNAPVSPIRALLHSSVARTH